MSLFRREPAETPEQKYFRENASRLARVAQKQANEAEADADRNQMGVDVYGRVGRDYSDPAKARHFARERDRCLDLRDRSNAQAEKLRAAAEPPAKKKSIWW